MKKILCYGDSNTWGCSPHDSSRFDERTRWPMVMGSLLGGNYSVIEEGLNGRTVLDLSPVETAANGIECIRSLIVKYVPVDIAIISLGLNDVFLSDDVTPDEIANGVGQIIDIIREGHSSARCSVPHIIVMSPSGFNTAIEGYSFFELKINKLKYLPDSYSRICLEKKCSFFNASEYVTGSEIDGSHLEADSHRLLGEKIAGFILNGPE